MSKLEPIAAAYAQLDDTETLTGELAEAYREFREAAADLDGKAKAATAARERAQVALARFTRLATGGAAGPGIG